MILLDKLQELAYANAARRGFWGSEDYTVYKALEHMEKEIVELRSAIAEGDNKAIEFEAGDVILLTFSILRHLGLSATDSVAATLNKELLREGG